MMSKQSRSQGKTELLRWINKIIDKQEITVHKIEQLGNGVAFIFILNHIFPGCTKIDKINKHPSTSYESTSNLKLLASGLEKAGIIYHLDIDKLVQNKYQDNFHLASHLHRIHQNRQIKQNSSFQTNNQINIIYKKNKIVPPTSKIQKHKLNNQEMNPDQQREIELILKGKNSSLKLKDIRTVVEEDVSNRKKLQKIAKILNIKTFETKVGKRQEAQTQTESEHIKQSIKSIKSTSGIREPATIEESYKRFLRPSICMKSKHLNLNNLLIASSEVKFKQKQIIVEKYEETDRKSMEMLINLYNDSDNLLHETSAGKNNKLEFDEREILLSGRKTVENDEKDQLLTIEKKEVQQQLNEPLIDNNQYDQHQ